MKSFFKTLGMTSLCTFSLLGLTTFCFSIYYIYSSVWRQLSLSLSINITLMYIILFGYLFIIIVVTIIASLVRQNRALKRMK